MEDNRKDILWRVYLVYIGVLIFCLLIIGKAAYIQFTQKDDLLAKANEQEIKYFNLEASRGNILDRDGNFLASTIPVFEIRMDVNSELISEKFFYDKVDSLSACLAELFKDRSKKFYKDKLIKARKDGNRYFLIRNRATYDDLQQLRKFPIFRLGKYKGGLISIQKASRDMPYKDLARRTIGYENKQENLFVGLEGAYTDVLSGKDGKELRRKINDGDWIPIDDKQQLEPIDGQDIVTTIDINIQDVAENALLKNLQENEAFQGCAVLMEVSTGDILAIANLRLNSKTGVYEESYNYAIGENFEPGSTFKLASVIAALEDHKIKLDDTLSIGKGVTYYYRRRMQDVHAIGDGHITVREAFEQSSNVGISKIITRCYENDPGKYTAHMRKMSIDKPLGIEIAGEGKPRMRDPKDKAYWSGVTLPWMSIGYGITMTPLQILTLYNAVANDGVMVKPRFVKEIQQGGTIIKNFDTQIINPSICSKQTIKKVKSLLEGVVLRGTATMLKDSVYQIAGKTGTAQIAEGKKGYAQKLYNATFVGYFPADAPKYSCIVVINKPHNGKIYGGAVAAPVFKEVADHVYASNLEIQKDPLRNMHGQKKFPTPASGYYEDLKTCLQVMDYRVPSAESSNVIIYADKDSQKLDIKPTDTDKSKVPDVMGMNPKDAIYLIEKSGMVAMVTGKGMVSAQSIPAGSDILPGSIVRLNLSNN